MDFSQAHTPHSEVKLVEELTVQAYLGLCATQWLQKIVLGSVQFDIIYGFLLLHD